MFRAIDSMEKLLNLLVLTDVMNNNPIILTLEWVYNAPLNFFGLKSESLDQLPKALLQLFLDNEYMF